MSIENRKLVKNRNGRRPLSGTIVQVNGDKRPFGIHIGKKVTPKNALRMARLQGEGKVKVEKVSNGRKGLMGKIFGSRDRRVVSEAINEQGIGRIQTTKTGNRRLYNKVLKSKPTTTNPDKFDTERGNVSLRPTLLAAVKYAEYIVQDRLRLNKIAKKDHEARKEANRILEELETKHKTGIFTPSDGGNLSRRARAMLKLRPHAGDKINLDINNGSVHIEAPARGIENTDVDLVTSGFIVREQKSGVHRLPILLPRKGKKGVVVLQYPATGEDFVSSLVPDVEETVKAINGTRLAHTSLRRPKADFVEVPSLADLLPVDDLKRLSELQRNELENEQPIGKSIEG